MESPWAPGLFWFPPPSPRVNTNPAPQPPTSHGAVPPPRAQPQRGAGQWPPCAGPDPQRGGPAAAKGRRPRTGFCLTRKTQNQKGGGVGLGPPPGMCTGARRRKPFGKCLHTVGFILVGHPPSSWGSHAGLGGGKPPPPRVLESGLPLCPLLTRGPPQPPTVPPSQGCPLRGKPCGVRVI